MRTSDTLAALAPALAQAQSEIKAIEQDGVNPHFKSRYASLHAIMDEIRPILARQGLSIIHGTAHPEAQEGGRLVGFSVETMLLHKSGEFIANVTPMPVTKHDAQSTGAALTYGRRYGIMALLSLATDDEDSPPPPQQARPRPLVVEDAQGDPPSEKQIGLLHKLIKSHVFTDAERKSAEGATSSKARTSKAIEWAQEQIAARKAAEAQDEAE